MEGNRSPGGLSQAPSAISLSLEVKKHHAALQKQVIGKSLNLKGSGITLITAPVHQKLLQLSAEEDSTS